MRNRRRVRLAGAAVLVALALAGCGAQAGSKAGGPGTPVVLRMATMYGLPGFMPQVDPYLVNQVAKLSAGNVQIDMVYHVGENAPGGERQVVRDVAAGKYDLGVVGTRVFDTLGVDSFQALTAPMLIDSYPLQRAVIGSGIPARMMRALDTVGVRGLGVLADGLRKPIAVRKPLLGPADWRGVTFAAFPSREASEAIRALGATPSDVSQLDQGLGSGTVGGFEKNLLIYRLHPDLWKRARYVTANVDLWPQTLAVIGNPDRLARLTSQQRGWLTEAVRDAAARSTGLIDGDARLLPGLCAGGTRFANASPADLAALRNAFASVYAQVEQDPLTKEFIAEINHLKQHTPPGPALVIPGGCTGPASGSAAGNGSPGGGTRTNQVTPLDGVWEVSYTRAEFAAAHPDPSEVVPENYGSYTLRFHRGGSWFTRPGTRAGPPTTYVVHGDTITFYHGREIWKYKWSVYRQTLTFQKLGGQAPDCSPSVSLGQCEPTTFVVKPWRRVSA